MRVSAVCGASIAAYSNTCCSLPNRPETRTITCSMQAHPVQKQPNKHAGFRTVWTANRNRMLFKRLRSESHASARSPTVTLCTENQRTPCCALHSIENNSRRDSSRGAKSRNSPKIRPLVSEQRSYLPSLCPKLSNLTTPITKMHRQFRKIEPLSAC
jgi:hypothetical protein